MMRAEGHLQRDEFVRGAWDAKHGRRIMLDLLADEPRFVDCRFWLGSYDYFAAVVPRIVKFLRALLFLPAGDRQAGLDALEQAAGHGVLDRFNALWILHEIHAHPRLEGNADRAHELLQRVHEAYPDSVNAALELAWSHGRSSAEGRQRCIAMHRETLARVRARADALPADPLERRVRLSLARAYLSDLQPEVALETVRPAFEASRENAAAELRSALVLAEALNATGKNGEAVELLGDLGRRHPGAPDLEPIAAQVRLFDGEGSRVYHAALAARRLGREGRFDEAEAEFARVEAELGPSSQVEYWRGRMYFDAQEHARAEPHFLRAVEGGPAHAGFVVPESLLRLGNLRDLAGQRGQAKAYYRRVIDSAGELVHLRATAERYLERPFSR
jgi:tetratricopeptide (TPR) repeat protein